MHHHPDPEASSWIFLSDNGGDAWTVDDEATIEASIVGGVGAGVADLAGGGGVVQLQINAHSANCAIIEIRRHDMESSIAACGAGDSRQVNAISIMRCVRSRRRS